MCSFHYRKVKCFSEGIIMSEIDLPLVDLSQFPHDEIVGDHFEYHPEMVKLREACKEWGFFRVVNHGIPPHLLPKAVSVCRDILAMPAEVKKRVQTYQIIECSNELLYFSDMPNPDSIQEVCGKIWPEEGNSDFCEAVGTFSSFLSDLATRMLKLIVASLGLDARKLYESDFKNCTARALYVNGYSSSGKCRGDLALVSHADPGLVAILHNNELEGLQIQSTRGEWFNVKPAPDSFIVNIGESMKVWCNGRYRSTHHRVMYKGWRNRISLPFFILPQMEAQIWAPEELVDDDNPRRYKRFIFSEFVTETNIVRGSGGELPKIIERWEAI